MILFLKIAHANVKRIVREAKWNYWRAFSSNIGTGIQVREAWGMIWKMGGISKDFSLPVIRSNSEHAITNLEKAEMHAKSFVKNTSFFNEWVI